jgi:hypothetical protein
VKKGLTKSTGILRYSPQLLGNRGQKWWLVLDCDPSVGQYYRHLYWLARHRVEKMLRPAWQEHITVVRNEEPPLQKLWQKHEGLEVGFWYNLLPATNGTYWWLQVECSQLLDIREELGLSRDPEVPLHLSFGHTKE